MTQTFIKTDAMAIQTKSAKLTAVRAMTFALPLVVLFATVAAIAFQAEASAQAEPILTETVAKKGSRLVQDAEFDCEEPVAKNEDRFQTVAQATEQENMTILVKVTKAY